MQCTLMNILQFVSTRIYSPDFGAFLFLLENGSKTLVFIEESIFIAFLQKLIALCTFQKKMKTFQNQKNKFQLKQI